MLDLRLQKKKQDAAQIEHSEREARMDAIVELTRNDILGRLEKGAQRRRGMSAREMVLRYRLGTLEEPCEVADLLALTDLLPANDPLFDVV